MHDYVQKSIWTAILRRDAPEESTEERQFARCNIPGDEATNPQRGL